MMTRGAEVADLDSMAQAAGMIRWNTEWPRAMKRKRLIEAINGKAQVPHCATCRDTGYSDWAGYSQDVCHCCSVDATAARIADTCSDAVDVIAARYFTPIPGTAGRLAIELHSATTWEPTLDEVAFGLCADEWDTAWPDDVKRGKLLEVAMMRRGVTKAMANMTACERVDMAA